MIGNAFAIWNVVTISLPAWNGSTDIVCKVPTVWGFVDESVPETSFISLEEIFITPFSSSEVSTTVDIVVEIEMTRSSSYGRGASAGEPKIAVGSASMEVSFSIVSPSI